MGKRRGPPPKPTTIKRLEGNPGQYKINNNEPDCPQDAIDPPKYLDTEARREWRRLAPWATQNEMLRNDTVQSFAAYCQSYSDYHDASKQLKKAGKLTKDGRPSPWIAIQDKAFRRMHTMALEFGLTSSSRSRIITPAKGEGDALDKFLSGKN